jgi:hypothetical protein
MIKVRLSLPNINSKDIDINLPSVPQIGSEFTIGYDYYVVESVNYEILLGNKLGLITVYLEKA